MQPRLTLAAFGKHPGWNDHIPGIGVETDVLARAQQKIYVGSIGRQIDSGAWEQLEAAKLLPGFAHTFLWLRPGHAVLGRLWSSTDGKGRSKYPMVLCVDGEGVTPSFLFSTVLLGLERLREACRANTSAERVTSDCAAAQEQLRQLVAGGVNAATEATPSVEARRRFLEDPGLGPDRRGILRILHQLLAVPGFSATATGEATNLSVSRNLRVPLAAGSGPDAMVLWATFLRCALRENVPILLVVREGTDWVDIVVGEPDSDDLFCLQTNTKATPLTTEIPFELAADLPPQLARIESRFLGEPPPAPVAAPAAPPTSIPRETPPPLTDASPKPPEKPSRKWPFFGLGAVVVVAGLVLLLKPGSKPPTQVAQNDSPAQPSVAPAAAPASPSPAATEPPPANPVQNAAPAETAAPPPTHKEYEQALAQAQAALYQKDFSAALAKADTALTHKPDDAAATRIKSEAQAKVDQASAAQAAQKKYELAVQSAQTALAGGDLANAMVKAEEALGYKPGDAAAGKLKTDALARVQDVKAQGEKAANFEAALRAAEAAFKDRDYNKAVTQAEAALKNKPGDPNAQRIRADGQQALQAAQVAAKLEQDYQTALKGGREASGAKEYSKAIALAKEALKLKPGDAVAQKLKTDSEAALQADQVAQAKEREFASAMQAAQANFSKQDYAAAVAQADAALKVKPTEPTAVKLRQDSQSALQALLAKQETEKQYAAAISAAQAALDKKDFATAQTKADEAAKLKSNDPAAAKLKTQALQGQDLTKAQALFAAADYAPALDLCGRHNGVDTFSSLAAAIRNEQAALEDGRSKFARGDYSFLGPMRAQSYAAKPPFKQLLAQADSEKALLDDLQKLRQGEDRAGVKAKLAEPAGAGLLAKAPFKAMKDWSETSGPTAEELAKKKLAALDADYERLMVWFNLRNEGDKSLVTPEGKAAKRLGGGISADMKTKCIERVDKLIADYKTVGQLSQNDRERNLKKLRETIQYWQ